MSPEDRAALDAAIAACWIEVEHEQMLAREAPPLFTRIQAEADNATVTFQIKRRRR